MRKGFSLVELLVGLSVMIFIFTAGLIIDTKFYRRANLDGERDTVVSLLSRARAAAINNVDQTGHGLYISSSTYTLFEGNTYATRATSSDEIFPVGGGVNLSGQTEFDFKALEGAPTSSGTLTIANDVKSLNINVNAEGLITW